MELFVFNSQLQSFSYPFLFFSLIITIQFWKSDCPRLTATTQFCNIFVQCVNFQPGKFYTPR